MTRIFLHISILHKTIVWVQYNLLSAFVDKMLIRPGSQFIN